MLSRGKHDACLLTPQAKTLNRFARLDVEAARAASDLKKLIEVTTAQTQTQMLPSVQNLHDF
jgi:hypothetical protein